VGAPSYGVNDINHTNPHWASLNIWYQGGDWYWDFLGKGGPPQQGQIYNTAQSGMFTVTAVPVPTALPLLLSGIAGLGFMVRGRKAGLA
jgi:hypothetical protein